MSRLTRDGTAEPVSRDQILRHARGQGNTIFPVQLTTSGIGNLTRLIHTLLYVMTIHAYIHICVTVHGDWKATALKAEVWVETVTEGGRRFMAAWRKEEVDAARHRQEKREATRLGTLLSQTGV